MIIAGFFQSSTIIEPLFLNFLVINQLVFCATIPYSPPALSFLFPNENAHQNFIPQQKNGNK